MVEKHPSFDREYPFGSLFTKAPFIPDYQSNFAKEMAYYRKELTLSKQLSTFAMEKNDALGKPAQRPENGIKALSQGNIALDITNKHYNYYFRL